MPSSAVNAWFPSSFPEQQVDVLRSPCHFRHISLQRFPPQQPPSSPAGAPRQRLDVLRHQRREELAEAFGLHEAQAPPSRLRPDSVGLMGICSLGIDGEPGGTFDQKREQLYLKTNDASRTCHHAIFPRNSPFASSRWEGGSVSNTSCGSRANACTGLTVGLRLLSRLRLVLDSIACRKFANKVLPFELPIWPGDRGAGTQHPSPGRLCTPSILARDGPPGSRLPATWNNRKTVRPSDREWGRRHPAQSHLDSLDSSRIERIPRASGASRASRASGAGPRRICNLTPGRTGIQMPRFSPTCLYAIRVPLTCKNSLALPEVVASGAKQTNSLRLQFCTFQHSLKCVYKLTCMLC